MLQKIQIDKAQPGRVGTIGKKMSLLCNEFDYKKDDEEPVFKIIPEEVATRRLPQGDIEKIINHKQYKREENSDSVCESLSERESDELSTTNKNLCGQFSNQHIQNNYNNKHTFERSGKNYSNQGYYNCYGNFGGDNEEKRLTTLEIANYLAETEYIYNYNGVLYVYDEDLKHYICATAEEIIALARDRIPFERIKHLRHNEFKGVYDFLLSDKSITLKKMQVPKGVVLFNNGMYDIKEESRINKPEKVLCLCKIDANYGVYCKTPNFDRFIEDVSMGDKQIKKRIWCFLAYCLIPDMDGKCFFVLGTAPNTGKSMLASFIENLIGEEYVSNVSLYDFNEHFALGSIVGKSLNTSMDLSGGRLNKKCVEYLKLLTGKDKTNINEKYEKRISYSNRAKFVFGTNVPVYVGKDVDGFWDRLIIVPFLNSIPKEERDPKLFDKIWAERDGIVNIAMEYAKKLIKREYRFPDCRVADAMRARWMYGEDYEVVSFVENCCDLSDEFAETRTVDLYGEYKSFCEQNYDTPKTKIVFSSVLKKMYDLTPVRKVGDVGQYRGYQGIRLKQNGGDTL